MPNNVHNFALLAYKRLACAALARSLRIVPAAGVQKSCSFHLVK